MDPESVINLFDSCWFNHEILKKDPSFSLEKINKSEPKYSSLRSILVRSQSEDIGNTFNCGSFSPNSVLKSIPSGKFDFTTQKQEHEKEQVQVQEAETTKTDQKKQRGRKKNKSLSDLEFEELKGFMDLGFVFSQQDKYSSLVEIIPGLQRFGEEREKESDDHKDSCLSAEDMRPYLSEAWEDLDRKSKKKEHIKQEPLMINWEIPALRDETDMKVNLKLWAHTVASSIVR